MAMEYKNVRTTDISRREGLLSALDDLAPLPAPYDKNGLEPAFKDPNGPRRTAARSTASAPSTP